jgi:hypothetical protein
MASAYTSHSAVWYRVRVAYAENLPNHLFGIRDVYVGVHTKPAGDAGADLNSRTLATAYRDALMPIYERRYGECELEVVEVKGLIESKDQDRIDAESALVQARIETNTFAPNKRPAGF